MSATAPNRFCQDEQIFLPFLGVCFKRDSKAKSLTCNPRKGAPGSIQLNLNYLPTCGFESTTIPNQKSSSKLCSFSNSNPNLIFGCSRSCYPEQLDQRYQLGEAPIPISMPTWEIPHCSGCLAKRGTFLTSSLTQPLRVHAPQP